MFLLELFCGDEQILQSSDATLNSTSVPHISECYQHTVLVLIPCLFLTIFLPIVLYALHKTQNGPLKSSSPISYRIFFCALLIADVGALLAYGLYQATILTINIPSYHIWCPGILLASLTVVFNLLTASKKHGLVASGVLFNFWLLLAVCGFPEFRHKLDQFCNGSDMDNYDSFRSILYMIYYPLVLIELILSCFADTPANIDVQKKTCPELYVSFLNQVTFWWFSPLAVTGNRRPLVMDDLWDLNARDRSEHLLPKFEEVWRKYVTGFYKSNKPKPEKVGDKIKLEQNGAAKETEKLHVQPSGSKKESKQKKKPVPSVLWPLFKTFKWPFLGGAMYKLIFDLLQFASPQLLSALISFVEDPNKPLWMGIAIAMTMFIIALVQSMILHQYFHTMFRIGMYVKAVLTSMVYKKALVLSNTARKNRTVGEIVNLMSVDIQRFQDSTFFVNLFWSSPLQVLLAIFFLYRLLGVSVFAGLLVLIGLIPLNSVISNKMRSCQTEQMKYKDERIKLMSDVLNGIKILKLYAWEASIQKQILNIRKKELKVLKKLAYLQSTMTLMWSCAPFLVAVFTFGVYVTIDPENNILTPQVTFVALSLFNILRFPLAVFGMVFGMTIQLNVSNKRLKTFLAEEEIEEMPPDEDAEQDVVVSMKNGNFAWDSDGPQMLNEIDLSIKKGSLVAIVGKIGAGKSSLLSALLGEMHRNDGFVSLKGRVAYVPQQAWIQNLTLKANVLFNRDYDEKLYQKVLEACSLTQDLATLPAGDATEIGEKGINLSGGQKQRVSLARALYSESDIYLLDDPLAAVDAHVGKSIFENVISSETGLLKNKTRIFVTHGLHFLKHCDQIIVMKDGRISESGTYEGLIKSSGDFSEILEEFLEEEVKNRGRQTSIGEDDVDEVLADLEKVDPSKKDHFKRQISQLSDIISIDRTAPNTMRPDTKAQVQKEPKYDRSISTISRDRPKSEEKQPLLKVQKAEANGTSVDKKPPVNEKAKLIETEGVETGKVKFIVYMTYIRAIGFKVATTFFLVYLMGSFMGIGSNLWLANWSDHAKEIQAQNLTDSETHLRLGVYTALGLGQALFISFAAIIMALGMVYASSILHENMLSNILRSPMSFFDVTPIGRILNRFSKDVDGVDTAIPRSLISFVQCAISSLEILIVIAWATPAFLFVIGPLAFVYLAVLRFYVSTSRQLKRLESTSRSPIYSHFQESIQGASSIRAYHCVERSLHESQQRVDHNLLTYYPGIVANRWLAVRLELVGNLIVLSAALSAALFRDSTGITAGLTGLAVSYALNITQTLNWAVRMTSELETNIVAVERIKEYSETPTEAELETHPSVNLPKEWPDKGVIDFDNLQIRYRPELDLVLKGLSANIKREEKVGIIGRTGAGKSSLTLALFRIVEPTDGTIYIDKFDITKIGLYDLRSRLTIVPQDPVLFTGTLRMNLDPFDRYDDSKIWHVLRLTHMDSYVESLPERLHHKITEGGENLSVGQRQLICLARALLRKSKILVLDEAAASVDMETDQLIQRTIKEQFADCTVLTIAHRLHSVVESDRLMVLDTGNIREFDSPKTLLDDHNSLFYSMALDAGLVSK